MVRAILDNRKSMTRRVLKPKKGATISDCVSTGKTVGIASVLELPREMLADPKYKVGDLLWVREAWRTVIGVDDLPPRDLVPGLLPVSYEADGKDAQNGKLRPGMFMPRWMSRITLRVTDVKVERLQDISEADARAEGAEHLPAETGTYDANGYPIERGSYRYGFYQIWTSINGLGSWESNPWVAAYSFERVKS
jgi:hypothetical protein